MMSEFQIWSQNSNRTIFEPLFDQKTVENWQNTRFGLFLVFGPKMVTNVVFSTPYLEYPHHLASPSLRPEGGGHFDHTDCFFF